jgi:malate-CoA ligase subunit alpha
MSILIHKDTRIIVQGMSGRIGKFHAEDMIAHGTNVVGGVTPGRGGETVLGRPIFNTVAEAVEAGGRASEPRFRPAPRRGRCDHGSGRGWLGICGLRD